MCLRFFLVIAFVVTGGSSFDPLLVQSVSRCHTIRAEKSNERAAPEPEIWKEVRREGFGFFSSRTRLRKDSSSSSWLDISVKDGDLVTVLEEEINEFSRVRTKAGVEGLIRSVHLIETSVSLDGEDWEKPLWFKALESQAARSAERRKDAQATADDTRGRLVGALTPLQILPIFRGKGSLIDDSDNITANGWYIVALFTMAPVVSGIFWLRSLELPEPKYRPPI
mmetsp:Transcript_25694/g.51600  ORF Transcript_25694/g.51600 Transcript_25694/m.51600 type:complete len:224 (-) Transcript_25694:116-787(-)